MPYDLLSTGLAETEYVNRCICVNEGDKDNIVLLLGNLEENRSERKPGINHRPILGRNVI